MVERRRSMEHEARPRINLPDTSGAARGPGGKGVGYGGGKGDVGIPPYRLSSLLYDRLVGKVLHQLWAENFERLARRYELQLDRVADVACGTGLATAYLARRGSRVIGVDRSEEMLRLAAARLRGCARAALLRQDMRYLYLPWKVRTLLCATDSLNHLLAVDDVRRAASSFARALEVGGRLLFDVNTAYQLREGSDDAEWSFRIGEWRLTWRSEWEEATSTATLTMRLEREKGGEGTWVEVHRERAYPAELLVSLLEEVGFRKVEVLDFAGLGKPGAKTRRLQFVAVRDQEELVEGRPPAGRWGRGPGRAVLPRGGEPE